MIIFEEIRRNTVARDVLASFMEAAYQFWVIPRDGAIERYTDQRPEWCDVLAVPARRLAFVQGRLGL